MSINSIAGKLYNSLTGGGKPVLEDSVGLKVEFDAVMEDTRGASTIPTKHAVEGDSDISNIVDNVKPEEPILNLKIVLSNHFITSVLNPKSLLKTAKGSLFGIDDTIRDRLKILEEWRTAGDILNYTSKRRTFDSAVISNMSDAITKDTGDGVMLTLTLERVNIANSDSVTINRKKPMAAKEEKTKGSSAAKRIVKALRK